MSVDDHGLEVLKKSGLDIGATPKKDYAVQTASVELATKLDTVSNITYVGKAPVGTSSSEAVWQIKKIEETGEDLSITFADGDSSFNNVWDNRLSLTYS
jgi:hypothetical protein